MVRSAGRAWCSPHSRSAASAARALCWPSIAESAAFVLPRLAASSIAVSISKTRRGVLWEGILFQMCKSIVRREIVSGGTGPAQPQEQYTRGLACTGTTCGLVGTAAISWTSLLRVASLNCSRSLIVMTKDPGPPMTQSS
jgi:hypothetical protein